MRNKTWMPRGTQPKSRSIPWLPLTSRSMSCGRPVRAGCPVRDEMTSTMMGAPHLAVSRSPERYLLARVDRQRRCWAWQHRAQFLSRHPKLLQAGASGQATQDGLRPGSRSACTHWVSSRAESGQALLGPEASTSGACSCTVSGRRAQASCPRVLAVCRLCLAQQGLYLHPLLGHMEGALYGSIRQRQIFRLLCRQERLPCSAEIRDGVVMMHFVDLIPGCRQASPPEAAVRRMTSLTPVREPAASGWYSSMVPTGEPGQVYLGSRTTARVTCTRV